MPEITIRIEDQAGRNALAEDVKNYKHSRFRAAFLCHARLSLEGFFDLKVGNRVGN